MRSDDVVRKRRHEDHCSICLQLPGVVQGLRRHAHACVRALCTRRVGTKRWNVSLLKPKNSGPSRSIIVWVAIRLDATNHGPPVWETSVSSTRWSKLVLTSQVGQVLVLYCRSNVSTKNNQHRDNLKNASHQLHGYQTEARHRNRRVCTEPHRVLHRVVRFVCRRPSCRNQRTASPHRFGEEPQGTPIPKASLFIFGRRQCFFFSDCDLCTDLDILSSHSVS